MSRPPSGEPMLTIEEAVALVRKHAKPLPPGDRSLIDALGCVLAEDVAADRDEPPFDKALVDGYAVRAADLRAADRPLAHGRDDPGRPDTRALRSVHARRP